MKQTVKDCLDALHELKSQFNNCEPEVSEIIILETLAMEKRLDLLLREERKCLQDT